VALGHESWTQCLVWHWDLRAGHSAQCDIRTRELDTVSSVALEHESWTQCPV
jgi:hypothetical protein